MCTKYSLKFAPPRSGLTTLARLNAIRAAQDLLDDTHAYSCKHDRVYPSCGHLIFSPIHSVWVVVSEEPQNETVLPSYLAEASREQVISFMEDCSKMFDKGREDGDRRAKGAVRAWLGLDCQVEIADEH